MDESLSPGLVVDVRMGASIVLGDPESDKRVVITVEQKSGQRVRLRVQSKDGIPVEMPRLQK